MRPSSTSRLRRPGDKPAPLQFRQGVVLIDGRQPRDRPAAARHDDLRAPLDALKVLAQTIVKLAHPDLVPARM
jgi:hypothetical protein